MPRRSRTSKKKKPVPAPGDADAATWLPAGLSARDRSAVTVLRGGGETYPAMLAAIGGARKHVHLETYILRADREGRRFADALAERARAGVAVRLLYDWIGCLTLPAAYLAGLSGAGVSVLPFRPPRRPPAGLSLHRRDHQKILVVDDEVAFTGGLNIGDEYDPVEAGGSGWHDLHAEVRGPAVVDLARVFWRTWLRTGGERFPAPSEPAPGSGAGPARVLTVDNRWFRARSRMRRIWLHALRRAERSVVILNSYFIPDPWIRRALYRAVARGVSVRIIVPQVSDVEPVRFAGRHLYGKLLRRGVRILEWPQRMMHAKAAAIDGVWSTIGSFNLDRRSFFHNLEVGIVALDRGLAREIERQFDLDAARCVEVDLDAWRRRPRVHRALDWLCYQFRSWL